MSHKYQLLLDQDQLNQLATGLQASINSAVKLTEEINFQLMAQQQQQAAPPGEPDESDKQPREH